MEVDSTSSSEDEHSSSDCEDTEESQSQQSAATSSYQSEHTEEQYEDAVVCNQRLQLPQGLCESSKVFKEFFSARMWNSLSDASRQHLKQFLPTFPDNDNTEKNVTLQKLFNCERIGFSSPLEEFHKHLQQGHYRPSMIRTRNLMRKVQRHESRVQQRRNLQNLVKDVIASRQWLLNMANSLPPDAMENTRLAPPPLPSKPIQNPLSDPRQRTKRRYFQELHSIRMEVGDTSEWSDDENYPEGFDPSLLTSSPQLSAKTKYRKLNNSVPSPLVSPGMEEPTISTLVSHKQNNHPEIQITDDVYKSMLSKHKTKQKSQKGKPDLNNWAVNLKKIASRTMLSASNRKTLLNLQKSTTEVKPIPPPPPPPLSSITPPKKVIKKETPSPKSRVNNIQEVKPAPPLRPLIIPKTEIKTRLSSESELDLSDNESIIDPVLSPQDIKPPPLSNVISIPNATTCQSMFVNSITSSQSIDASTTELLNDLNIIVKSEPSDLPSLQPPTFNMITSISQYGGKIQPATLSDLEGIDMLNLPVDLDESNIGILDEITRKTPELMQETHTSFLSLIRDIICSTPDHRMSYATLESRMKSWQENPISPLNDWYNLVDNWLEVLSCAVSFLNGDFSEQPEDFVPYLELKPLLNEYQWIGAGRDSDNLLSPLFQFWIDHREEMTNSTKAQVQAVTQNQQVLEVEQPNEIPKSPPPPRWPTSWTVRKAEPDEIEQFREQERRRYENPHKAFTYRMFGYESVVGPVKGIYNQTAGVTKPRGHSMLSSDRPNFVTILTLVRDATARLPNGEGTRVDICELLKSSQYIAQGPHVSEQVLQSVVSGALDRMHTEYDPCVKYDVKRKIWIYLHRNRTEAEFEKIHAQHQGMSKHQKKSNTRKSKPKPKVDKLSPQKGDTNLDTTPTKARFKTPPCKTPVSTVSVTTITDTPVKTSPVPGTSLLINQNKSLINKTVLDKIQSGQNVAGIKVLNQTVISQPSTNIQTPVKSVAVTSSVQTLQSIIAPRVNSPKPQQIQKTPGKSIVKIVNPQGKSLINAGLVSQPPQLYVKQANSPQQVQTLIPSLNIKTEPNLIQIQQKSSPTLITSHANTQLIQTIVQQGRQATPLQARQLIQNLNQQINPKTATLISQGAIPQQIIQVTPSGQKITQTATLVQTKQGGKTILTTASAQQLLQNIKQQQQQGKVVAVVSASGATKTQASLQQQGITVSNNSQTLLKQQAALQQLQKQLQQNVSGVPTATVVKTAGTSLLDQTQRNQQANKSGGNMSNVQAPLVAKVLTNASGQVISVESLLAHQKQHGSLPQGTTLRVAGGKLGQANLIQLSGAVPNQLTQFAVVSQGNLVSLTGQPRLIASVPQSSATITSTTSNTTSQILVATPTKSVPANKNIRQQPTPTAKLPTNQSKVSQVVNAKFITAPSLATPKLQQQQMIKTSTANSLGGAKIINATTFNKQFINKSNVGNTGTTQTIRMINPAGGLNFAHIAGKPILLASKGNTALQGQNIILRQGSNTPGGTPSFVISSAGATQQQRPQQTTGSHQNTQQQIVLTGAPLKIQNIASSSGDDGTTNKPENRPQQTLLLQTQPAGPDGGQNTTQRVVLASSGQGGQLVAQQILLPQGFQGGTINIKTLQGLKVIPLAAQQGKGIAGRQQLFTRIVNPVTASAADTSQQVTSNSSPNVKATTER